MFTNLFSLILTSLCACACFAQELTIDTVDVGNLPVVKGTIHVRSGIGTVLANPGRFVDVNTPSSDVYSLEEGKVHKILEKKGEFIVLIKNKNKSQVGYFNLDSSYVPVGKSVKKGDKIGSLRNSNENGYMLRFGIFSKGNYLTYDDVVRYLLKKNRSSAVK